MIDYIISRLGEFYAVAHQSSRLRVMSWEVVANQRSDDAMLCNDALIWLAESETKS